jgi:hypothetical protein
MELTPFEPCATLRLFGEVRRNSKTLEFSFRLEGETSKIVVPSPASPRRTEGLWQATCFEAFLRTDPKSYIELNFSPSGEWAAYQFTDYRVGMRDLAMAAPEIQFRNWRLTARVELLVPSEALLSLAAVIEHSSGARTYWALAHPSGNRPDFHAPDCFVAKLP